MHIHAHTVSDLSPFCVQFTASQWKPKSGDPFFGVVVFTFPQKTSTGPPWERSAKARIRATFLATHNAAATVPLSALLLVTRLADGGKTAGFSGHSSPGFFWKISKNLQLVPGKKTKKCVYIYIPVYVSLATLLTGY